MSKRERKTSKPGTKKGTEKGGIGTWQSIRKDADTLAPGSRQWSADTYRILGYETGEIPATSDVFFTLTHPDDVVLLKDAMQRAIDTCSEQQVVVRMKRKDGTEIIVQVTGTSEHYLGSDQWMKLSGTIQDITARLQEANIDNKLDDVFNNTASSSTVYNTLGDGIANHCQHPEEEYFPCPKAEAESMQVTSPSTNAAIRTTERRDPAYEKKYFPELTERLNRTQWHLLQSQRIAHIGSWQVIMKDLHTAVPGSLQWSEETYRIFGYKPTELTLAQKMLFSRVHPEDLDKVKAEIQVAVETCSNCDLEYRIVRKDGSEAYVHLIGECEYYSGSDRWVKITGTLQDITTRKKGEQLEASLNSIFANTTLAYVVTDVHLNIVSYNKAASEGMMAELGLRFNKGDSIIGYTLPARMQGFREMCTRVLQGEKISYELNLPREDGSVYWYQSGIFPIVMENKEIVGIAISMEDITERKRAEELVQASEAKYRSFFENSIDGLILTEKDGKVLAANPAACALFRMTEEEICAAGRFGIVDTTHPNVAPMVEERQRTGHARGEVRFLRKDGTRFPGILSTVVYKDMNGEERMSAIIHDLTGIKE